jgi:hypothetical protein
MFGGLLLAVSTVLLSNTSPAGVPAGETIATWERMSGQARSAGDLIAYELHVQPQRRALYALTRYRVLSPAGLEPGNEMLIWNAQPGTRQPLLCFERVSYRDWRTMGASRRWAWEPVQHGTDRYRVAMATAIRVYYLHQATVVAAAREVD